jgi:hypothetical protein
VISEKCLDGLLPFLQDGTFADQVEPIILRAMQEAIDLYDSELQREVKKAKRR